MKLKMNIILCLVMLLVVMSFTPAFAAQKYGARAYGMGGAFTAVADDSTAIYWNPAGLVQSGLVGMQFGVGSNPDQEFISDAQDVLDASSKLEQFNKLDQLKDTEMSFDLMATGNFKKIGLGVLATNDFTYNKPKLTNMAIGQGVASWGVNLLEPPLNIGAFSMGFNVKGLWSQYDSVEQNLSYDPTDPNSAPTIEGSATAKGYGVDFGALAKVTDMVNLGLSIKNVTSTLDWEWDSATKTADLEESLPRTVTVGAAVKLPYPLAATVAADIESPENGEDIYHFGIEKNILFNGLSLRGGMYKPASGGDEVITGGLGLNLAALHANLAMDSNDYASLSVNLNF
ncbi:hypothetical protein SAMN04488698_103104 [Candidatus Frackibacter sp. WG12]|uniref:hypothetical protein n=1 Tax=Candidatus Frackibacter sp. WG12 TaxID=2017977 RepID=UPI000799CE91|nr:hypothetical protein [Candidatus Frackibacter sp. WG12]KXS41293.1 MAG: hypothetical protein AWU54_1671 [Candidatus Frackibacter sp. T328-2]SEM41850.1 hypothetical protein SAMN04488698_103104 [Candidatus Frackibacter sp. WG12]